MGCARAWSPRRGPRSPARPCTRCPIGARGDRARPRRRDSGRPRASGGSGPQQPRSGPPWSRPPDGPVDDVRAAAAEVKKEALEQDRWSLASETSAAEPSTTTMRSWALTGSGAPPRREVGHLDDRGGLPPGPTESRSGRPCRRRAARRGRGRSHEASPRRRPERDGSGRDDDRPVTRTAHHLCGRIAPTSGDGTRSAQSCP